MDYTLLKSDNKIPNFGIGTWGLGENKDKKEKEIKSIVFALNNGVRLFLDAVKKDNVARYSAEICMVTFGGIAELYQDFTSVDNINFYDLEADGATPMEDAVLLALDALERRKQEYKDCGVEYYQPWMVIMTDGYPYPDPLVNSYKKTYQLASSKKLSCFQIGVGEDVDWETLAMFSPREPKKIEGYNFEAFFEWLAKSIQIVSKSNTNSTISLPSTSSWESTEV